MTDINLAQLASLARLEVSGAELAKLEKELPAILAFVETIQKVAATAVPNQTPKNVVRADTNPHESGMYTERLVKAAPAHEKNQIVVKQVISRAEIFSSRSDHENPSMVSKKATPKK